MYCCYCISALEQTRCRKGVSPFSGSGKPGVTRRVGEQQHTQLEERWRHLEAAVLAQRPAAVRQPGQEQHPVLLHQRQAAHDVLRPVRVHRHFLAYEHHLAAQAITWSEDRPPPTSLHVLLTSVAKLYLLSLLERNVTETWRHIRASCGGWIVSRATTNPTSLSQHSMRRK